MKQNGFTLLEAAIVMALIGMEKSPTVHGRLGQRVWRRGNYGETR